MALGDYRIVPGLVTEEIGREILVCDADLALVHRVSGRAADVLRQVLANRGEPAALESDDITSGLVAAGVLVAAGAPGDLVSRRSFVNAAAAVGAMGIVTLALPRAAAASSVVGGDVGGGGGESNLPAAPSSAITTNFDFGTGRLRVFWEPLPAPFNYTYTITLSQGTTGTGALTGTLAAGETLIQIFNIDTPGGSISVQFTSITSPSSTGTSTFTRNA
jgi:hypothetical protein